MTPADSQQRIEQAILFFEYDRYIDKTVALLQVDDQE